jgi:hypothetical protein
MRSHAERHARHARRNASISPVTVGVERTGHGAWEVAVPEQYERVTCETLEDARRAAYLCAVHGRPRELIVCDADRRILHDELINGPVAAAGTGDRGEELA